jgi:hypothetical protein
MARDGEHFFMIFGQLKFFLKSSVAHFLIGSLIWGEFSFLSSLYILVINPLSDVKLATVFSHSVGHLFSLETISFVVHNVFNFV